MKKTFSYTAVFVAGFVVCVLALKTMGEPAVGFFSGADSKAKQAVLTSLDTTPRPMPRSAGDSVIADAAAKLEPAIVDVHTVGKAIQPVASPFGNDPILRRFFGGSGMPQAPVKPEGAGSGVIISADGYILTNNHVVANSQTVKVAVGGNRDKEYDATVIGTDPVSDIAVIKINPAGVRLQPAVLGDSDETRVGDWAIAVGNPLDIGTTVTLGIISAKGRRDLSAQGHPLAADLLQTDAAINPGNSGGALANIDGQVVGINEAILSPTGSYVGIGLAIPINDAKKIAAELIKNGKITRPYLGIQYGPLKDISVNAKEQIGIPDSVRDGVIVSQVFPNTPAAQAGLKTYDVILEANQQKIADQDMLNNLIQKQKVGDTLTLLISRGGRTRSVPVTLRERPQDFGETQGEQAPDQSPDQQQMIPLP